MFNNKDNQETKETLDNEQSTTKRHESFTEKVLITVSKRKHTAQRPINNVCSS